LAWWRACATIGRGAIKVTRRAAGFREWLEDVSITPEALEWVRNLSEETLEVIAEALDERGFPLDTNGRPVGADRDEFWDALNEVLERFGF
jgi:hypothetical protein